MAEWLRSGLQSRLHRFDSGWRLSTKPPLTRGFCAFRDSAFSGQRVPSGHQSAAWLRKIYPRPGATAGGERINSTRRTTPNDGNGNETTGTRVQTWLPISLAEQLKAQADLERRSISSAIRIAVEDQLRRDEPERRP